MSFQKSHKLGFILYFHLFSSTFDFHAHIRICICIPICLDDVHVQFGEAGVGAGTMYALARTTFTKQALVTFKISNIS